MDPPSPELRTSKRTWDVLIRKWRRALHMFDDVYIDGQELDGGPTLDEVVEQQRLKWLSPRFEGFSSSQRVRLSTEHLMQARSSVLVPKRLPVEESLRHLLRSPECYECLTSVVPDTVSSLTRGGTGVAPHEAGVKILVAPTAATTMQNGCRRSPSPDMPCFPATVVRRSLSPSTASPQRTSPSASLGPDCSPMQTREDRRSPLSKQIYPFEATLSPPPAYPSSRGAQ
jgi:hypothetical protein